jgi:16S rRNA (guanine966-N2)-methyltransferase
MRVVTGEAKGRRLKGPTSGATRPIIERVKQALFNILSLRVEDARFLDLFAGTGSVGIEALSRGAAHATFIEMNYKMLQVVRENLRITGLADRAETLHTDAFKFLQSSGESRRGVGLPRPKTPLDPALSENTVGRGKPTPLLDSDNVDRSARDVAYDIIYVAPPQYHEMAARALGLLDGSPLLAPDGLVIVQIHPKERPGVASVLLTHLELSDERRYGSTLLMFYENKKMKVEQSEHVNTTTNA